MRGLVILLLIVVIISSFSFVAANIINIGNLGTQNRPVIGEHKSFEFSTYTSAVCENKADVVHCKDEVFVNCNGEISKLIGVAECNGLKLDVPKATGAAVFGKDWKDPRQ